MTLSMKIGVTLAGLLLSVPVYSFAESVIWSENLPNLCLVGCRLRLSGVSAQVQYKVSIVNADTNASIPSGTTVNPGTRVTYKFGELEDEDVYWTGTGSGQDTPYGNFITAVGQMGDFKYVGRTGHRRDQNSYSNFVVLKPKRTLSGLPSGCTTESDGVSKTCTLTQPGTVTALFIYGDTPGRWYGWYTRKLGLVKRLMNPEGDDTIDYFQNVSVQPIPHTITVNGAVPPGEPASPPTITASGAACVTGTPFGVSMSSTDPDNDQLRYLIDWNNDAVVDQIMPIIGNSPSGTTITARRAFATEGSKTIRIRSEDATNRFSAWATFTFDCTGGTAVGALNDGNNGLSFVGDGGLGAENIPPDMTLRALPALVRKGFTTQIHWNAANVDSCTVTAPNGDSWTGENSPVGGEKSGAIQAETTYTLKCLDIRNKEHIRTTKVRILPVFQEK